MKDRAPAGSERSPSDTEIEIVGLPPFLYRAPVDQNERAAAALGLLPCDSCRPLVSAA